jgi:hypothetical protein
MALADLLRYGLGLVFLIGAATFLATIMLVNHIRSNYPNLYNNIGRPTFLPLSTIDQWRFVRFIIRRDYSRVGDRRLALLGDVILFGGLINIILIILGAILQRAE